MKKLFALILISGCIGYLYAEAEKPETEYICAISGMDSTYITRYKTFQECKTYCKGLGAICEETEALKNSE